MRIWQKFITDQKGAVVPYATITVKKTDGTLAKIYSSRGKKAKANPFTTGLDGLALFYVDDGQYNITAQKESGSTVFEDVELVESIGFSGRITKAQETADTAKANTEKNTSDIAKNTAYREVGHIPLSEKGAAFGVPTLNESKKVDPKFLPAYVDEILEYSSTSSFPSKGDKTKIYYAKDTDVSYRWGGTEYVPIGSSLALGETDKTAYAGDKGKANAESIVNLDSKKLNIADLAKYAVPEPDFYLPLRSNLRIALGNGSPEFTRNSTATYWKNGELKTAEIDEPRFENGQLLMESTSTNMFLNSMDSSPNYKNACSTVARSGGGVVITPSVIGSSCSIAWFSQLFPSATFNVGDRATYSCYTNNEHVQIRNGQTDLVTQVLKTTLISDGVYRISCEMEYIKTGEGNFDVRLPQGEVTEVWGFQIEGKSTATSLIPTDGAEATRSGDTLVIKNVDLCQGDHFSVFHKTSLLEGYLENYPVSIGMKSYGDNLAMGWTDNLAVYAFGVSEIPSYATLSISKRWESRSRALIRDGLRGVVMLDGDVLFDEVGSSSLPKPTSPINITIGTDNFCGYVSDIKIWDSSLTLEQISMVK